MGGDSELTPKGEYFAQKLNEFFQKEKELGKVNENTKIFTSTLKRGIATAEAIKIGSPIFHLKILDELNCGIFENLTHKEMTEKYPKEFKDRQNDKLSYRYPRGESYLDLIHRLEPIIFEVERSKDPVIIVSHTCVLRCLYAYFSKHEIKEVPHLKLPSNTIFKLIPEAYFCYENRLEPLFIILIS